MKNLAGKYAQAVVYAETFDTTTQEQVNTLLDQKFTEGSKIRIMPDTHAGKGCVIGTTMTLPNDRVCPNLVGVDLNCGMLAIKLEEAEIDFSRLDQTIRAFIPFGRNVHEQAVVSFDLNGLRADANLEYALKSIGTLGGGNHFIEVDRDSNGSLWLVIHSGSRHLGVEIAEYYQKLAVKKCHSLYKETQALIAKLKSEGRQKEISSAIAELKQNKPEIPDTLCYIEGSDFDNYLHDMDIARGFAHLSRQTMADIILDKMNLHSVESFETLHNYIDTENRILRKGSISAQKGEKVLIPINMRDGSLVCIGKGNPDWNFSAPHGAGRVLSRKEARNTLALQDFQTSMKDVWTSSVCDETIDESPMAYKPMDEILRCIEPTVDVVDTMKPVYNFKAAE